MSKKMIAATTVLISVFVTAVPVYAQTVTPVPSHGFFGEIENFFGNFFHHQNPDHMSVQNQEQSFQNPSVTPGENAPSGMMQQNNKGNSDYFTMQQNRVNRLVQQGLITQVQGNAIIAELQKVQTELKSWAAAEGINESYVIGGPGAGMGEGQMKNGSNQSGQNQQFKNHGTMSGQGEHGFQQGNQEPSGNFNRQGD